MAYQSNGVGDASKLALPCSACPSAGRVLPCSEQASMLSKLALPLMQSVRLLPSHGSSTERPPPSHAPRAPQSFCRACPSTLRRRRVRPELTGIRILVKPLAPPGCSARASASVRMTMKVSTNCPEKYSGRLLPSAAVLA
jgi:hypothetical protein